jgi:hypothetical protein
MAFTSDNKMWLTDDFQTFTGGWTTPAYATNGNELLYRGGRIWFPVNGGVGWKVCDVFSASDPSSFTPTWTDITLNGFDISSVVKLAFTASYTWAFTGGGVGKAEVGTSFMRLYTYSGTSSSTDAVDFAGTVGDDTVVAVTGTSTAYFYRQTGPYNNITVPSGTKYAAGGSGVLLVGTGTSVSKVNYTNGAVSAATIPGVSTVAGIYSTRTTWMMVRDSANKWYGYDGQQVFSYSSGNVFSISGNKCFYGMYGPTYSHKIVVLSSPTSVHVLGVGDNENATYTSSKNIIAVCPNYWV